MATLILFNKPYGTLCQFTGEQNQSTLAEFISTPNVYAAGRLDKDSEGLLLLTDNGSLQHKITHPKYKSPKTYWVQVEGKPDSKALHQLQQGVQLKDGVTLPADVNIITAPENLWTRHPPVRFRKHIPTTWLSITLYEGRNRQVRRMTAACGYPTLRLIRARIGNWELGQLQPGQSKLLEL